MSEGFIGRRIGEAKIEQCSRVLSTLGAASWRPRPISTGSSAKLTKPPSTSRAPTSKALKSTQTVESGTTTDRATTVRVSRIADAAAARTGLDATCARHSGGGIDCFGEHYLGNGTTEKSLTSVSAIALAVRRYPAAASVRWGDGGIWGTPRRKRVRVACRRAVSPTRPQSTVRGTGERHNRKKLNARSGERDVIAPAPMG
jgi:hypothetical protein